MLIIFRADVSTESPFIVFRFSVWQRLEASDLSASRTFIPLCKQMHSWLRDKADEFGNTLLYRLLSILGYLLIWWKHPLHNASDVGHREISILPVFLYRLERRYVLSPALAEHSLASMPTGMDSRGSDDLDVSSSSFMMPHLPINSSF